MITDPAEGDPEDALSAFWERMNQRRLAVRGLANGGTPQSFVQDDLIRAMAVVVEEELYDRFGPFNLLDCMLSVQTPTEEAAS